MSGVTIIPNQIARGNIVPPMPRLVLLALASHAGSKETCRVRKSTLVAETGLSRTTVTQALKWLSVNKFVTITGHFSSSGRSSSTYTLNLRVYEDVTVEDSDEDAQEEGVENDTPAVLQPPANSGGVENHTPVVSGGGEAVSRQGEAATRPVIEEEPLKKNPSIPPSPSVTREEAGPPDDTTEQPPPTITEEQAFEMFWQAFPRRERMVVARAAFTAAIKKGADPRRIISGAQGYARQCRQMRREEQYISVPANWLREERWTDEYPAQVAAGGDADWWKSAGDY